MYILFQSAVFLLSNARDFFTSELEVVKGFLFREVLLLCKTSLKFFCKNFLETHCPVLPLLCWFSGTQRATAAIIQVYTFLKFQSREK